MKQKLNLYKKKLMEIQQLMKPDLNCYLNNLLKLPNLLTLQNFLEKKSKKEKLGNKNN